MVPTTTLCISFVVNVFKDGSYCGALESGFDTSFEFYIKYVATLILTFDYLHHREFRNPNIKVRSE